MRNKNFQILEIGTFRPLLVKFILEIVKDRGNPSTYYWKLSTQYIIAITWHLSSALALSWYLLSSINFYILIFFSGTKLGRNVHKMVPSLCFFISKINLTKRERKVPISKIWKFLLLITLQSCIWLTNDHFTKHAKNKNICIIQAI
jgi:hypothetical protein